MTGINHSFSKMFRWLKDKKKTKPDKKDKVEDDYGFRKKQIILQETENGHSVIIKDDETTLVYPQSFCRFHYRARMPTPVQHVHETSTHIYDEIPEHSVRTKLEFEQATSNNEADLIKDTRIARDSHVDLKNAIEVGPYLIVPIVNSQDAKGDVEIFKRNSDELGDKTNDSNTCNCNKLECSECKLVRSEGNNAWDTDRLNADIIKDTKIVLTRCVKSKTGLTDAVNFQQVCSVDKKLRADLCSFLESSQSGELELRNVRDSPSTDSSSRTLTGTPDSSIRTSDTLSERSESCAIEDKEANDDDGAKSLDSCVSKNVDILHSKCHRQSKETPDGNETSYEFDLSTSGESDVSREGEKADYELYLSKIESNLQLKHNVRKMVHDIESMTHGADDDDGRDTGDLDSMTYVSSLSEYSSAASHISDVSADRSASDDSSGYYECLEDVPTGTREKTRESHVSLERSVSAPESDKTTVKSKLLAKGKRLKDKNTRHKKLHNQRSKSFDCRAYKSLSDEDKEMYKFPSTSNSTNSLSSRHSRNKPVPLAPQPTPVYMEPYRGKSRSHNRLLGDLIRMNYDKQLFFH